MELVLALFCHSKLRGATGPQVARGCWVGEGQMGAAFLVEKMTNQPEAECMCSGVE